MHYTGTIWRPPYEAASLLLEVTAGCTHHKCKFCTLYNDLPFKFRMSPLEDIESDLREVKRATKGWNSGRIDRVFLTGANPFVLSYDKLTAIAELSAITAWYSKHPPFLISWIFGTILGLISWKGIFISKNSPFFAKN